MRSLRLEADGRLEIDTDTSLPRLASVGDGAWEVRLSSVPSFVRLAPPGLLSFARVADLIALVLILAGAVWTWRTARAGG